MLLKPGSSSTQLAFYVNLYRAVIGPSATLTGRWRPDIDLRRMLTGLVIIAGSTKKALPTWRRKPFALTPLRLASILLQINIFQYLHLKYFNNQTSSLLDKVRIHVYSASIYPENSFAWLTWQIDLSQKVTSRVERKTGVSQMVVFLQT